MYEQEVNVEETAISHALSDEIDEMEWEEWDGRSPFLYHCIAGSIAGVAEHTLIYPLDTIKTNMQSHNIQSTRNLTRPRATGVLQTATSLLYPKAGYHNSAIQMMEPPRFLRLFRGVQVIALGCVPAHALYFSSYEMIKSGSVMSPMIAGTAGAVATVAHDAVMTPIDTIKQRLQLGHYEGMMHAFRSILCNEGPLALYRSFPVTLLSNIPYGAIAVCVNESLRGEEFDVGRSLYAGSVAGFCASLVTTPLDRIKTCLQTQKMGTVVDACMDGCKVRCVRGDEFRGVGDAFAAVVRAEGWKGLWRGSVPRVLIHTPSVAICWTTYDGMKSWLMRDM